MAWIRFFHKQKGWKGDNCERAPSTGTSSLSISLRPLGEGLQMSPGLASCIPGSPLLSRSLDWVSPLPGHCRRVVSASPGWDSPLRTFAERLETQKLADARHRSWQRHSFWVAFGTPRYIQGDVSPCCQPLSFTQAQLHSWCLSTPGVPENTPILSGGIRAALACYMIH